MEDNSTKALVQYETYLMTSVMVTDYLKQPPDRWFALKEAYEFYAPMTDIAAAYLRNSNATQGQLCGLICKLLAIELRKQHFHLAPRIWLGGTMQTSVWRSAMDYFRFDEDRTSVLAGTRGAPAKAKFDLSRKWKMGELK